jgi:SAM-dependent methyltransferase
MNLDDIKKHWTDLAVKYQQDISATTKTVSIKKLEIKALYDAIVDTALPGGEVLEVGCGNGLNCFALAEQLPKFNFTGVDYVSEMVSSANTLKSNEGSKFKKLSFYQGDILKLQDNRNLQEQYDIVFTDRCIINLNSPELQEAGISNLIGKVRKGGYMIILENIKENHQRQNDCREAVGLTRREVPAYNLFIDESNLLSFVSKSMTLKKTNDFGSLHDLLLYVFVPMTNGGIVDYDHPVVHAATSFLLKSPNVKNSFGNFGQNRLYLFHKE